MASRGTTPRPGAGTSRSSTVTTRPVASPHRRPRAGVGVAVEVFREAETTFDEDSLNEENLALDDGPDDIAVPDLGVEDDDLDDPEHPEDDARAPLGGIPDLVLFEVSGGRALGEQRVETAPPPADVATDAVQAALVQTTQRQLDALGRHLWATQPKALRSRDLARAFTQLVPQERSTLTDVVKLSRSGVARFLRGRTARTMAGVVPLDFFFWADVYLEHDDRRLLAGIAAARHRGDVRPLPAILADLLGPDRPEQERARLGRRALPTLAAILDSTPDVRAHRRLVRYDDGHLWERLLDSLEVPVGRRSKGVARMALAGALDPTALDRATSESRR